MSLANRFNKLSPREQKLAGLFILFAVLMVFVGGPIYAYMGIASDREYNTAIRTQLRRMDRGAELLAQRRSEREQRDLLYARKPPAMASFIEKAAHANGLEVPRLNDQPELDAKGYVERPTKVHMSKVGLLPLVKMLERVERGGYPIAVSRLKIKKKSRPDQYDVELTVSAYEKKSGSSAKGKKSKKSKKSKKGKR